MKIDVSGKRSTNVRTLLCVLSGCAVSSISFADDVAAGKSVFTFENDIFTSSDDNYTNGVAFGWVTGDAAAYDPVSAVSRWAHFWSFMPGFAAQDGVNYLSWSLSQEMHTPEEITRKIPDPADQPYSGFLLVDFNIYSMHERWGQVWNLRAGVVGPLSKSAETQRAIHKAIGDDLPAGCDYQIKDEAVFNIGYTAGYKLFESTFDSHTSWRFTPVATAGLGTYSTDVGTGFVAELGWNMPQAVSMCGVVHGVREACAAGLEIQHRWSITGFIAAGYSWVYHYLPLDGPVFRNGPSVGSDVDSLVEFASVGVSVNKGRFSLIMALSQGATPADRLDTTLDYGTLTFVYQH